MEEAQSLARQGLRKRLRKSLGRNEEVSVGLSDSQSAKGTVHAGNGFDGGKKINGRKRHLLVDTLGLLLVVTVTKANLSDQAGLKRLLAAISGQLPHLKLIKADEAYRGRAFIAWVKQRYQRVVEIVSRPEGIKGFVVQPQRWVVEMTHSQCCRTSLALDSYAASFISFADSTRLLRGLKPFPLVVPNATIAYGCNTPLVGLDAV